MDERVVWSKEDSVFVLVIFKVIPQSVVEGNRVGFLFVWRGEDKEVISLLVLWVTCSDSGDPRVSCLPRIWF